MLSALAVALLGAPACAQQVMIQFEPMDASDIPDPHDLFSMLGGPGLSIHHSHGPSPLGSIFDQVLGDRGFPMPRRRRRNEPSFPDSDSLLVEDDSPSDFLNSLDLDAPSSMSAMDFHDLFPVHLSPPPRSEKNLSQDAHHDALLNDMLQHLTDTFTKGLLPSIQRAAREARPKSACDTDVAAMCDNATSQLHCLGQHGGQVSEPCKQEIGKSVPYLCSAPISDLCNVLDRGILPCLADHLDSLEGSCRDAVMATHRLILKLNTQTASMIDVATGETTVHKPAAQTTNEAPSVPMEAASEQRPEVNLKMVAPKEPVGSDFSVAARKVAFSRDGVAEAYAGESATKQENASRILQGSVVLACIGAILYVSRGRTGTKSKAPSLLGGADEEMNGNHIL